MDISFNIDNKKFNYRVCAIIISNGKILAMHDDHSPYYYLPGGRVKMGETAEQAIIREIQEELNIKSEIIRPLWLNQAYFNEDVDKIDFHEICIYFLMDVSGTDIFEKGSKFSLMEKNHITSFEWLKFDRIKNEIFYLKLLKKDIFCLPESFTIHTEIE